MQCLSCGSVIEDDSFYCDQCGLEIKVCELCGTPGKGKRCTRDGKRMIGRKDAQSRAAAAIPESSAPTSDLSAPPPASGELLLINKTLGIELRISRESVLGQAVGDFASLLSQQTAISSSHARIVYDKAWLLIDLGSTNGTWVQGQRISPQVPIPLADGVKIRLANVEFLVSIAAGKPDVTPSGTVRLG